VSEEIPTGSRWLEVATGRVIVILGPGPNSPTWRYEDDPPREFRHCCVEDFTIWGRFRRLPAPAAFDGNTPMTTTVAGRKVSEGGTQGP
jgi:hypothetical protein